VRATFRIKQPLRRKREARTEMARCKARNLPGRHAIGCSAGCRALRSVRAIIAPWPRLKALPLRKHCDRARDGARPRSLRCAPAIAVSAGGTARAARPTQGPPGRRQTARSSRSTCSACARRRWCLRALRHYCAAVMRKAIAPGGPQREPVFHPAFDRPRSRLVRRETWSSGSRASAVTPLLDLESTRDLVDVAPVWSRRLEADQLLAARHTGS